MTYLLVLNVLQQGHFSLSHISPFYLMCVYIYTEIKENMGEEGSPEEATNVTDDTEMVDPKDPPDSDLDTSVAEPGNGTLTENIINLDETASSSERSKSG